MKNKVKKLLMTLVASSTLITSGNALARLCSESNKKGMVVCREYNIIFSGINKL